ncbi:hypothetical protein RFI_08723 [Reticulomyxa filosa]|uniref:Cysteine protease n=1 Tax=Reticulomyxa filosa TaxID=46433 RepID=X6NQ64_RETFI|nr:hypothetical protein RFI_08723 [Reticulomyxa filosa]|eukprot:ETO28410.1 hypothetical protein RFI_08723 [Reticulomyxa filosa]
MFYYLLFKHSQYLESASIFFSKKKREIRQKKQDKRNFEQIFVLLGMSSFEVIEGPPANSDATLAEEEDLSPNQIWPSCSDSTIISSADVTAARTEEEKKEEEKKESEEEKSSKSLLAFPFSISMSMSSLSDWTQPLNTLFSEAKHRIYTLLSSNSGAMFACTNPHSFNSSDTVWIMGEEYKLQQQQQQSNEKKEEEGEEGEEGEEKEEEMDKVLKKLKSIIWITYRNNFEVIKGSKYTSDAGWGCMIRTTQMMFAQGLSRYWNNNDSTRNDNNKNENKEIIDKQILSYFNDSYDSSLSLHNMLKHGECLKKSTGTWFGPTEACVMMVKSLESSPLAKELTGLVAMHSNGVIYKSEIIKLCCDEQKVWKKAIFIFVPLRLGLDQLNANYIAGILGCLQFRHSIGFVGGKPQRSLYFVGHQNQHLFYLDPHTVFDCSVPHSVPTYCHLVQSLSIRELDPSMALGFFIRDQRDFDLFWSQCLEFTQIPFPIFTVGDHVPTFDDRWEDVSVNSHDHGSSDDSEWEKL